MHTNKTKIEAGNADNIPVQSYPESQISEVVRTVFEDSRGNFWFGTQDGAFVLQNDSLVHLDQLKSESGKGVTIKAITESKDGVIWLGHTDGISRIDGEVVTNFYEADGLISDDVWCILADRAGQIWIGTIAGVCVYNGHEFFNFPLPEGKVDTTMGISSPQMVHSIYEDREGTLWFSCNAGLYSYSNDTLINISQKTGIQTNFINGVFEDKDETKWVSTKNGLYQLTANCAANVTEGKIETGKGIGSIAEDKDGKLWFVSNQHYLYTYDEKEIIEIPKADDNSRPVIFQIYKDRKDRLWFVGFGGAFRLEDEKFIHITKGGPWW